MTEGQKDEGQPTITGDLKILEWIRDADPKKAAEKHSRATLVRLSQKLNIDVDPDQQRIGLVESIKLRLLGSTEIVVQEVVAADTAPGGTEDFNILEGNYGIRCGGCGEIPIVCAPGFDPRSPMDGDGKPMPAFLWPYKFRGFNNPGVTKEFLYYRSREDARCTFCERPIPFAGPRPKSRIASNLVVELVSVAGKRNPVYPLWEATTPAEDYAEVR